MNKETWRRCLGIADGRGGGIADGTSRKKPSLNKIPLAITAARLPPFPQKQKCRRLRVKTTVAPAAKVDKQPNPS